MISINATLVVQIINFLVLIWILNHILFKPIFKIMEERESVINEAKAEVVRLQAEAEGKREKLDNQLRGARQKASKRKDQVRDQANTDAGKIIDTAREQAFKDIEAIKVQARKQADEVRAGIGDYKDAMARMVFVKIMGRNLS